MIKVPQDNAYGSLLPNGSFNGMIAMLMNNVGLKYIIYIGR